MLKGGEMRLYRQGISLVLPSSLLAKRQREAIMAEEKVSDDTLTFVPIDPPEKTRRYLYPGGNIIALENVTAVCVRPSGTHRVETADGKKQIIAPGWLAIEIDTPKWTF